MGRRFSRVPAVVVLAVLSGGLTSALTGCQSNPAPRALPPPTPSRTSDPPSPSPSAVAPTMPAAAKGTGPRAAKAFARFYFESVNYAALSGDTRALKALAAAECDSCKAITKNIDQVYAAGGRVKSESWRLQSVRILQARSDRTVASLDTMIGREVIVLSSGKQRIHRGGRQPMTMFLRLDGDRPVVARLDLVTS